MFAGLRSRWTIPARARLRALRRSAARSATLRRAASAPARCAPRDPRPRRAPSRALAAIAVQPVDLGDVLMAERGERLGFALNLARRSGSLANASGRTLMATSRFSCRIARPIHFAHSTFAELREHLIRTDGLTDHQGEPWATVDLAVARTDSSASGGGPPSPSLATISYGPRRAPGVSVTGVEPDSTRISRPQRALPLQRPPRAGSVGSA